ncbi:MAG: gamma-glutamylcyclotransferase [Alsobacter sp.]|jgi:cation transport protein ChaC
MTGDRSDIWVFGYGSLMWNPGFRYVERAQATLHGFHRSLCVYSHVHRGTPERPGLVLGLDRGGSCRGVAFRVPGTEAAAAQAYLRAREQVTLVYREIWRRVRLLDGRTVEALAYAVDRRHRQYARGLRPDELLHHVLQGVGVSGRNPDYVRATHAQLSSLGVHDATLDWLVRHLPQEAQEAAV